VGVLVRPQNLKKCMKLNFLTGISRGVCVWGGGEVLQKIPFVGEVLIDVFGTTQSPMGNRVQNPSC